MKNLVEKVPALNEVVNSVMNKTKEIGDTTNSIMGFCNGSSSFSVSDQNNDATKNSLSNDSVNADALTQTYKFIKDNCRTYQQLTGQFITFDSK